MSTQTELALIPHEVENRIVQQRAIDGYINATAMCKAAERLFGDYYRLKTTKAFLEALEADMGIPITGLVQVVQGGQPELQGTWVHPQVAIHLAQWLRPEFAVQVTKWVFEWMSGQVASRAGIPDHIRRYTMNQHRVPPTHFSMLNQMVYRLLAPLEAHGYVLPSGLMPDISLGKIFSNQLRDRGHKPDDFPTYLHQFPEGDNRPDVYARLYPNSLLTEFNEMVDEWLRTRARAYFKQRDQRAILPLERVLQQLPPGSEPAGLLSA